MKFSFLTNSLKKKIKNEIIKTKKMEKVLQIAIKQIIYVIFNYGLITILKKSKAWYKI